MNRLATITATIAVALTIGTGCAPATEATNDTNRATDTATPKAPTTTASKTPKAAKTPQADAKSGTALATLATLPVKGRAPKTGYDRDQFGIEWDDAVGDFTYTRNGCDTRNDILARDLANVTYKGSGCAVATGILAYEPYTGDTNRPFVRGGSYEQSFDIEHIVALGSAYVTGAQNLSETKRAEFANDPINLFAADPSANRQKGDADAATWLPANKSFRCSYIARQVRVKAKYGLWVTAPEKAAMERVLSSCPNEPLAQPEVQAGRKAGAAQAPTPKAPKKDVLPAPTPAPKPKSGGNVYYENCDAVRAAGAAPITTNDPGYSRDLDRDGDGSACES